LVPGLVFTFVVVFLPRVTPAAIGFKALSSGHNPNLMDEGEAIRFAGVGITPFSRLLGGHLSLFHHRHRDSPDAKVLRPFGAHAGESYFNYCICRMTDSWCTGRFVYKQ